MLINCNNSNDYQILMVSMKKCNIAVVGLGQVGYICMMN